MTRKARADFHFFHRRGGKILGGVQVICNMPFLILWKGHEMAKQSAPGRVKQHSSGVKHFLEGLRKIYEGFNPPPVTPPGNLPMVQRQVGRAINFSCLPFSPCSGGNFSSFCHIISHSITLNLLFSFVLLS